MSDECPDIEKVKRVAHLAELDEFIQTLPNGYNTKIGSMGLSVSGGQKQRIMIARALYKDPEILFLDEATSSLDAHTEKQIVNNLTTFNKGRTVIIAAHRLSTIKNADIIIYMKHGQIEEIGSHDYLIAMKGQYHDLVKNQIE